MRQKVTVLKLNETEGNSAKANIIYLLIKVFQK